MGNIIHFLESHQDIDRIIDAKSNAEKVAKIFPIFSKNIADRLFPGDYVAIHNPKINDFVYGRVYKVSFNDFAGSYQIYAVSI